MAEGTLVRWIKQEGEAVSKGEILAEIETDKATVEVESPFSGVVHKLLVVQGSVVPVGSPIAEVSAPGETQAESKEGKTEPIPQTPAAEKAEVKVTPKPEVEAQQEQEAAVKPSGMPAEPARGGPESSGSDRTGTNGPSPRVEGKEEGAETRESPAAAGGIQRASPLARRLAQEKGLDLNTIQGSGPGGRIVKRDIETVQAKPAAAPSVPSPAAAPSAPPPKAPTAPPAVWIPTGVIPEDQAIPVDRLRAAIGRRMVEAKQQAPHFYITSAYDVARMMDLRKHVNEHLPDDQKISVNDFIIKAAALTLRQFPNMNSALKGDQVIRFGHVNIGVAVSLEAGLITVVCMDADQKPLRVISREVKEMAARARAGKVKPADIEGSTFSISNLGMYDVENFAAIINPPEAAILAVGSVMPAAVVVDGELQVGTQMKATISADHRVTDGAEAARFMQALAQYLENPLLLLVG
jgi:pyruvate dehydrogenase E2 component (dihydrolipoamide acetyltransferase)